MVTLLASATSKSYTKIQFEPRIEHDVTMSSLLMVFGEIISVYCVNHTKRTNALCVHKTELLNLKEGDTCNNHFVLRG
jgi:hypothetical protein